LWPPSFGRLFPCFSLYSSRAFHCFKCPEITAPKLCWRFRPRTAEFQYGFNYVVRQHDEHQGAVRPHLPRRGCAQALRPLARALELCSKAAVRCSVLAEISGKRGNGLGVAALGGEGS